MSYRPYDRNASGIVFFGTNSTDQPFESNANFTIDGTTLKASNIAVSDGGTIGNASYGDIITLGADSTATFRSGVVVNGDLTVLGTGTFLDTQTLNVGDNIITLNASGTGVAPTLDAGIEIERGTSANVFFQWNEGSDYWEFTQDGTTFYEIASRTGTQTFLNKTIDAGSNTISNLTNANLNGTAGITNGNLANSSVTLGTTVVNLGDTALDLQGFNGVQATTFSGALVGNADTASALSSSVTIQLSDELAGSATFTSAGDTANIAASLTTAAITGQTAATSGNDTDFVLIASGTELRKITRANFVAGLGAGNMSSWDISAEGGAAGTVTQGDTVDFSGAGNITVTRDTLNIVISGEGANYTAGSGLTLDGSNVFHANVDNTVQTEGPQAVTSTTNKTYAVQVDASDDLVVNVPWTDTTYTAGSGLVLNGTTIDAQVDNTTIEIVTDTFQLKDTAVTAGSYGDPSVGSGVTFTVDAQGRLTAAANEAITVTNSNVTYTVQTITSSDIANTDVTLASGVIGVGLPIGSAAGTKRVVKRVDSAAGEVTISGQAGETIDGSANKLLYYQWESMTFVSDGSNWFII